MNEYIYIYMPIVIQVLLFNYALWSNNVILRQMKKKTSMTCACGMIWNYTVWVYLKVIYLHWSLQT